MYKKLIIAVGVLVALLVMKLGVSYIISNFFESGAAPSGVTATVSRVIDGDTIELANGDRVRLAGMDAPEKDNYYFEVSSDRLKHLIEGKTVMLEFDKKSKDNFDRLLRYVYIDDIFVNLQMIREGHAYAYVVAPNDKYMNEFIAAENEARAARLNIWESSLHSNCLIVEFHYNARGDDTENLNDEYVTMKNVCSADLEMTNWEVKDEHGNRYYFPGFNLAGGAVVVLHTGAGSDDDTNLYWNSEIAVWNNDGDTLWLRDATGKLIIKQSYRKG